ncbi:hypothetical protein [uncultured Cytophaga sp.]|uniref:hypothetical protein n=1 Tax=uncultured Cytophaga sp. TaxID=160238 RepID=UPI00261C02CC|nr:hypothetical protein [uncultured Cytophaga sp.]
MKKATKVVAVTLGVLLVSAFLIYSFSSELSEIWSMTNVSNHGGEENNGSDEAYEESNLPSNYCYVGDEENAYLAKGKLLDNSAKEIYDSLPDKLIFLEFGEGLQCTNCSDTIKFDKQMYNYYYCYEKGAAKKGLSDPTSNPAYDNLRKYTILAEEGKVEYPTYISPDQSEEYLITSKAFLAKYGDYFINTEDNRRMDRLPYGIKEKVLEFYQSEEGKDYRYSLSGIHYRNGLMWSGNLTGADNKEMVILFKQTTNKLEDNYMLLAFATRDVPYEKNKVYYIVYSEKFYTKVLMDHLVTNGSDETTSIPFYKNSDTLEYADFDGIVLKQVNYADNVLVYDKDFDRLVKYEQVPRVSKDDSNEYEEDEE